jgi:hypothetical protein
LTVVGGGGCPVPRQEFVQPVDLVIMDTVENVGETGLWIDAVQLGGLDDGHGAGACLGAGVCPCKKPVLTTDADGALARAQQSWCQLRRDHPLKTS